MARLERLPDAGRAVLNQLMNQLSERGYSLVLISQTLDNSIQQVVLADDYLRYL